MKHSGGGHMAKEEASPARIAIIEEWGAWAKKHPERARIAGGILFFNYEQQVGNHTFVAIDRPKS